jgi:solute carrier family 35, member F5
MFITFSSDFIYVIAMLKTTPLVVTIGLSLTIPVAVAGDCILNNKVKALSIFGALLVLVSFVIIGLEDSDMEAKQALNSSNAQEEEKHEPSIVRVPS